MPLLMPADTGAVLGENAKHCESRSLLLDRFCDPTAKEKDRQQVFTRAFAQPVVASVSGARRDWLTRMIAPDRGQIVYSQLQSRLLVNMAGGVMENAGLCLDRVGLPYIPGSAVKGCARRMATQQLPEEAERDQCGVRGPRRTAR
jgi:CRISPR/Cas system CMR subunit Cmr6 (Cas7 group RAMP superfamily)